MNTWRESPFYSEPERAALELTEVVTRSIGLLQARKSAHGILRLRRFPLKPPDCGRLKNVKGQLAILPKTVLFCNVFSYFLARTTADGINTIKRLFENGIKVHVLNMGLVEDTPTRRLILNVMLAFAEFERDMIVERTQEGKAIAKQKEDFREGRPKKYSKKQIEHALKLLENNSYKQVEDKTGISKSTLIRAKRKQSQQA